MRRHSLILFCAAILTIVGSITAEAQTKKINRAKRDSVVCHNRHWQFSWRGGYNIFNTHPDVLRMAKMKGGAYMGFGVDHYWKWFGLGADVDYIVGTPKFSETVDGRLKYGIYGNNWTMDAPFFNRLFFGVGPNIRIPSSCCPKMILELNTRAGVTIVNGGALSVRAYNNPAIEIPMYSISAYDQTVFSVKGQLRYTYYVTDLLGLSLGGYYLHNFGVRHTDNITTDLTNYLSLTQTGIRSGDESIGSAGVFGGITLRICSKEKIRRQPEPTLPPVVAKPQEPKKEEPKPAPAPQEAPKNTEYKTLVKVTTDGGKTSVPNATINVRNKATGATQKFVTNDKGEYSLGLKSNEEFDITADTKGYLPSETKVVAQKSDDAAFKNNLDLNFDLKRIKVKESMVLENLLYDLGKSSIRQEGYRVLERVVTFMKDNPEVKIEISSHTDSRSSAAFNKKLSQLRANNVKQYLIDKGIDASRIKAIGYGESKLLNKCKDGVKCTEEEHQVNRRTEMQIIQ